MFLLRTTDENVTDICMTVGFSSLGTFGRTFTEIVGEPPGGVPQRGDAAGRAELLRALLTAACDSRLIGQFRRSRA